MTEPYDYGQATCLDTLLDQSPDMRRAWERHAPAAYAGTLSTCWAEFHHQGPFTACLLGLPGYTGGMVIGIAKQCRYARTADAYDPLRGETIAFSRALQNAKQVLEGRQDVMTIPDNWLDILSQQVQP